MDVDAEHSGPLRLTAPQGPGLVGRRALAGALLALAGCAPLLKAQAPAHASRAANIRPEIKAGAFLAHDGASLPLKIWPALDQDNQPAEPWAVVIGLHGFNDTAAESFILAGPAWAKQGVTTYAFDQRGFGRAPGRGHWPGARAMTEDVRTLCALLRQRHPNAVLAVAGESMGGAVAISAFGSDRAPDADRLILLAPAVWGWDQQPVLNVVGLKLLNRLAPGLAVELPSWIADDEDCTDNLAMLRRMDADPDEINATRIDATAGLVNLMQDAERRISKVKVDTLFLYGAHDALVPKAAAFDAAASMGSNGRSAYYAEGWHLLARDLHADRVLGDVAAYLRDPAGALPSAPPPIPRPTKASDAVAIRT